MATYLGQSHATFAVAGEISYADSAELVTRHFVWRQSERAKITSQTRNFFLVSEILPEVGMEIAENVQRAFVKGLRNHFGIEPKSAILDSTYSTWDFV